MSSAEFESIFENAAAIVRIRCKGMAGLETVLESIRQRIRDDELTDPRLNRDLFFEPWLDSQQLGVPEETAEIVGRQLLELTVLRLWSRVRCPQSPPSEDGIFCETDSDEYLRQCIDELCPHCGTTHQLAPALVESVYAPNFPGPSGAARFDFHKLAVPPTSRQVAKSDQHIRRFADIAQVPSLEGQSILEVIALALDRNTPPEKVPSPPEAWANTWLGPLLIVVSYMILIVPISHYAGRDIATIVSCVVLAVVWLVISGQVRSKLAPSALQRSVTKSGICAAVVIVGAGTAGLEFSANDANRLTIPLGGDRTIVLPCKLEYGTVNGWLIAVGVAFLLCTFLFVLVYDQKLGWLGRPTT